MATIPVLWHFPISHYNEKVRWALDWKGVAHRRVALGPSYMLRAWWAHGQPKLPVLHFDDGPVGDSTHIIATLEQRVPNPSIYPSDAADRERALALEDYFDEVVGDPVRSMIVGNLVRRDPRSAIDALGTSMPQMARFAQAIRPVFQVFYFWRHSIDDAAIDAAPGIIESCFDRIEAERDGGAYLVGERFGVADLTAAALLGPILQPPQMEYPLGGTMPEPVEELRATLAQHPAWDWLLGIWQRHRGSSSEVID